MDTGNLGNRSTLGGAGVLRCTGAFGEEYPESNELDIDIVSTMGTGAGASAGSLLVMVANSKSILFLESNQMICK